MTELRIKTGNNTGDLPSLYTYAPHMNYDTDEIDTYWQNLTDILNNIPNQLIKMRRTDNNGQVFKDGQNKNMGIWTLGNKIDRGNGGNLVNLRNTQTSVALTHISYLK